MMKALLSVIDECENNIQIISSLLTLLDAAADSNIQLDDIEPLIKECHKKADSTFFRLVDIEDAVKESMNE